MIPEIIDYFLSYFHGIEQVNVSHTCKLWRDILNRQIPIERAVYENKPLSFLMRKISLSELERGLITARSCNNIIGAQLLLRKNSELLEELNIPLSYIFSNKEYNKKIISYFYPSTIKWFSLSTNDVNIMIKTLCELELKDELKKILKIDRTRLVIDTILKWGCKFYNLEIIQLIGAYVRFTRISKFLSRCPGCNGECVELLLNLNRKIRRKCKNIKCPYMISFLNR
ncbi:MAG: hypothetical protein QW303_07915 [Nitrososphaerota archaeon]